MDVSVPPLKGRHLVLQLLEKCLILEGVPVKEPNWIHPGILAQLRTWLLTGVKAMTRHRPIKEQWEGLKRKVQGVVKE